MKSLKRIVFTFAHVPVSIVMYLIIVALAALITSCVTAEVLAAESFDSQMKHNVETVGSRRSHDYEFPAMYDDYSPDAIKKRLTELKEQYPTGTKWTEDDSYYGTTACVAFARITARTIWGRFPETETLVSENAPKKMIDYAKKHEFTIKKLTKEDITVGSEIRLYNDTHTLVVIGVEPNTVTAVEGNYNGKIKWNTVYKISELLPEIDEIIQYSPGGTK